MKVTFSKFDLCSHVTVVLDGISVSTRHWSVTDDPSSASSLVGLTSITSSV